MTPLVIPHKWLMQINEEFAKLPLLPNSGKIILTFELNCGMGGIVNDIDCKTIIQKKWKH